MNKNFGRTAQSMKKIEGLSHRKVAGEFFNTDVRRGSKDGRKAPDAWSFALKAIQAEEMGVRDDSRSIIRQTEAEASANIQYMDNLLKQNKEVQERLWREGSMIPESVAGTQYSTARRDLFFAGILTCLDALGLITILKKIFGGNILLIVPLGILLISAVVFGIKSLLEYQNPEKRKTTAKVLVYAGGGLVIVGLIGVALLRSVTFDAALAGDGAMNMGGMSVGNLLFTIGIGLGLPLVLGVWYETESSKIKASGSPLTLYAEERTLLKARTARQAELKRLQEVDDKLDDITLNIISLRQNRYVRGYVRGARKNQNARQHIDDILKYGQNDSDRKALAPEPALALRRIVC
ncbi:MAG: hypothetical protein HQL08_15685 [Nitrospirae bacterium]|nr:hypothetical protein [Nitrospirota bacterium]